MQNYIIISKNRFPSILQNSINDHKAQLLIKDQYKVAPMILVATLPLPKEKKAKKKVDGNLFEVNIILHYKLLQDITDILPELQKNIYQYFYKIVSGIAHNFTQDIPMLVDIMINSCESL